MPPIVAIIGKSKSGKTTLIEKLLAELKSRGYRIATVKHTPHGMSFDEPGKDSWRHLQAGSEAAATSSEEMIALVKPITGEMTLEKIARLFEEDYDLVIAEGFKQGGTPKIEVHRREIGLPLKDISKLIAIATDEPLETKVRQFSLEDVRGIADFLEEGFIKPQRERLALYVNGAPVPLSAFPRAFISSVLLGMASSLKGVGEVKTLDIHLRR